MCACVVSARKPETYLPQDTETRALGDTCAGWTAARRASEWTGGAARRRGGAQGAAADGALEVCGALDLRAQRGLGAQHLQQLFAHRVDLAPAEVLRRVARGSTTL